MASWDATVYAMGQGQTEQVDTKLQQAQQPQRGTQGSQQGAMDALMKALPPQHVPYGWDALECEYGQQPVMHQGAEVRVDGMPSQPVQPHVHLAGRLHKKKVRRAQVIHGRVGMESVWGAVVGGGIFWRETAREEARWLHSPLIQELMGELVLILLPMLMLLMLLMELG